MKLTKEQVIKEKELEGIYFDEEQEIEQKVILSCDDENDISIELIDNDMETTLYYLEDLNWNNSETYKNYPIML